MEDLEIVCDDSVNNDLRVFDWLAYREIFVDSAKSIELTADEQNRLQNVIKKIDLMDHHYHQRIGILKNNLENMQMKTLGDGKTTCFLCGTRAELLKDNIRFCATCNKMVCPKCSSEVQQALNPQHNNNEKLYLCELCNEERSLMKTSGAWFFDTKAINTDESSQGDDEEVSREEQQDYVQREPRNQKIGREASDIDSKENANEMKEIKDKDLEEQHTTAFEKKRQSKLGTIKFSLKYDVKIQKLTVAVLGCKDLRDTRGKKLYHPYVETHILPDTTKVTEQRTPSYKKAGDPEFNEPLLYNGISEEDISNRGLLIAVMEEHRIGHGTTVSETAISLKSLKGGKEQRFTRMLEATADEKVFGNADNVIDSGRIELALYYSSKQGKLVVGINQCAGLKSMDPNGYSDPYVKCYLLPDDSKKTKRKTRIKKKTLNPVFNEEFMYDVKREDLQNRTLHVSVWDYDVGTTNDYIGGIKLGVKSAGKLHHHWDETINKPDRRVIDWHTLSDDCSPIHE